MLYEMKAQKEATINIEGISEPLAQRQGLPEGNKKWMETSIKIIEW